MKCLSIGLLILAIGCVAAAASSRPKPAFGQRRPEARTSVDTGTSVEEKAEERTEPALKFQRPVPPRINMEFPNCAGIILYYDTDGDGHSDAAVLKWDPECMKREWEKMKPPPGGKKF